MTLLGKERHGLECGFVALSNMALYGKGFRENGVLFRNGRKC
jgi:hypothetical protein